MKRVDVEEIDWGKMEGIVPVIAQDLGTGQVLTLAYVSREALEKTIETGWAHYYRRSHGRVMKKGVTSGNVQKINGILTDCDNDAILYLVEQKGAACHLGEGTCFHKRIL